MDDKGRLICGPHGRPWCEECSLAEERRLATIRERMANVPAGRRPRSSQPLPEWPTPTEKDRDRIAAELASLGLGKRRRR